MYVTYNCSTARENYHTVGAGSLVRSNGFTDFEVCVYVAAV